MKNKLLLITLLSLLVLPATSAYGYGNYDVVHVQREDSVRYTTSNTDIQVSIEPTYIHQDSRQRAYHLYDYDDRPRQYRYTTSRTNYYRDNRYDDYYEYDSYDYNDNYVYYHPRTEKYSPITQRAEYDWHKGYFNVKYS